MHHIIGILSATLCLGAMFYALRVSDIEVGRSVSYHAGKNSRTHLVFAAIMSSGIFLLAWYMFGWFIAHFELSWLFAAAMAMALILELVATWIPQTHGRGRDSKAHTYIALGPAVLMPVLLSLILISGNISKAAIAVTGFFAAVIFVFIYLYWFVRSQRNYYVFYQTAYIICFFTGILAVGLLG